MLPPAFSVAMAPTMYSAAGIHEDAHGVIGPYTIASKPGSQRVRHPAQFRVRQLPIAEYDCGGIRGVFSLRFE